MLRLSHVAIAVPDMAAVAKRLEAISLKVAETHEVPTERVRAGMVPCGVSSDFRIELLEPTSPESPISKFLESRKNGGLHHLSFEVTDIERWEGELKKAGIEILPPGIRKGARGRVLFLHPRSMGGVLVELEEISGR